MMVNGWLNDTVNGAINGCTFYLGTHVPSWLGVAGVPLFVSDRRLRGRRTFPVAVAPWALDSGGYSELSMHGRWLTDAPSYAARVERYGLEIGGLAFAASQDWMCEPTVLAATGLDVDAHQRRTVANYLTLRALAPAVPWLPVVQGFAPAEYVACVDLYAASGVDLAALPRVGVGSICRRQATGEAAAILRTLAGRGLRLHAFGLKLRGLALAAPALASADSMAWSFDARRLRVPQYAECAHANCANCLDYALAWRDRVLDTIRA